MELEIVNRLYLELSQFATAKTKRELELEELRAALVTLRDEVRDAGRDMIPLVDPGGGGRTACKVFVDRLDEILSTTQKEST